MFYYRHLYASGTITRVNVMSFNGASAKTTLVSFEINSIVGELFGNFDNAKNSDTNSVLNMLNEKNLLMELHFINLSIFYSSIFS